MTEYLEHKFIESNTRVGKYYIVEFGSLPLSAVFRYENKWMMKTSNIEALEASHQTAKYNLRMRSWGPKRAYMTGDRIVAIDPDVMPNGTAIIHTNTMQHIPISTPVTIANES